MVGTCDEDWVKKCMEYRVEARRPVGRPRRTWLESVEADVAELEIDKEDVHVRNKSSKGHNIHAVELSQRSGKPCANCVDPITVFWASRPSWKAGNAPHKSGRCRD